MTSTTPPPEKELLQLCASIFDERIKSSVDDIVDRLKAPIVKVIAEQLTLQRQHEPVEKSGSEMPAGGAYVPREEQVKAVDLRTAIITGKVPEETGILLDADTAARLLSISPRTLRKLQACEAIPASVRIGKRIVHWRLAEILAWIESGCPPRSHWAYAEHAPKPRRRR